MVPDIFQLPAVSPAFCTAGVWKAITEESKVKSPWNPISSSPEESVVVTTGSVKLVPEGSMVSVGNDTVAITSGGVGVGVGVGIGVRVGIGVGGGTAGGVGDT